jgi:hypothetical protein
MTASNGHPFRGESLLLLLLLPPPLLLLLLLLELILAWVAVVVVVVVLLLLRLRCRFALLALLRARLTGASHPARYAAERFRCH